MTLFTEIALSIIIAAALGIIAHLLKQPALIGFIAAGLIVGSITHLINIDTNVIDSLSSLGVALLLFIVGLDLDLRELKNVGIHVIIIGIGQVLVTFGIGFLLSRVLGFAVLPSVYISAALTFSSTIIVVKLLSEKKELKSLYGRIVVGVLIIQDFVAMLALLVLSSGLANQGLGLISLGLSLAKGIVLAVILILLSKYLPRLLDLVGHSQELLYLFSIAWALGVSLLAASPYIGLSVEVGGLLAGLTLANSAEHFQISSRLSPLRDFFVMVFFFGLGTKMVISAGAIALKPLIIFVLFVMVFDPLIVYIIMTVLGYRSRTSFMAGITMSQISEFSLVLVTLGAELGHITAAEGSLVIIVGVITMFCSSYLISYSDKLYELLKPVLKLTERKMARPEETTPQEKFMNHVILIGAHRMGRTILRALESSGGRVVTIDFDPVVVNRLRAEGKTVIYGDITDPEIQEVAELKKARVVISTAPDLRDNEAILNAVRRENSSARVILTADDENSGRKLYSMGADYVIMPHLIGGEELARFILRDRNFEKLEEIKQHHLNFLGNL
ncbi:MAG: cation:proton antiporter [Patescibacteria group bacterium]|nr:cation:proton antiporter [Patescibacteria group bacterium]MCL5224064.1 cation:proton antiporter [Patescibacteria group bacterium]